MGNFPDVPWLFLYTLWKLEISDVIFLSTKGALTFKQKRNQKTDWHSFSKEVSTPSQRRQRSINFFLPSRKRRKISSFSFCVNNSRLFRAKDLDHSGGDGCLFVMTLRIFFRSRHVSNSLCGNAYYYCGCSRQVFMLFSVFRMIFTQQYTSCNSWW